jgi:dihydroorotase
MSRIAIQGGRLIDPSTDTDALEDLFIAGDQILARGTAPDGFRAEQVINASGKVVCPGLVDLSARLREPGQEHKGTIASETLAAVSAGITSLCCAPDTLPVIDTPAVAELIRERAIQASRARVWPVGALTQGLGGEQLSEMAALKRQGCVALGDGGRAIANTEVLCRALDYAATHGLTVFLTPADPWLGSTGCLHEGVTSSRLGLPGIPETAETVGLARALLLVERTGVRAHFCRISCARALTLLADAQTAGLPVTADVAAHQLHLTETDAEDFDSLAHVRPPLRTRADRDALRAALADGRLSTVCSDHQPHEPEAKLAPFAATEPGISALETLLALTLRLVEEGTLALSAAIARLTHGPASVLGLDIGSLRPGAPADVTVFDPTRPWVLSEERLLSQGKNTPFVGWSFRGRVTHTLVAGRLVYRLDD